MSSRGGRSTRAILLAGGLTLALWPAVQAQPIRLTPPGGGQAAGQEPAGQEPAPQLTPPGQTNTMPAGSIPAPVMPAAPRPVLGETAGTAPQTGPGAEGGHGQKAPEFVIQPLKAPDPSSAGLLDDGNGGLGTAMWQGSNRAQAVQALGVLPAPVSGPALRDLQRRLLLSVAEVPPGNAATPSILGLRVAQLYRLGRLAEAERLGSLPSRDLKDPIFRELPFDLELLKNDLAKACEIATTGLREDASPFWQKATVLCRYSAKNIAGGDLALSLWRDGGGNDPAFNTLAAALRGDARAKVDTLGGATPLHFAMLRAAGRPLPKDTLDAATPALLVGLAGYDKADAETRLTAAERAVQYGALTPELLGEAYAAAEIPEAQRNALLASVAAGKDKSVRGAALLYQATKNATDAKTRAELVKRAYDLAVARDLLLVTAAVYKPLLNNLVPNENSIAAAPAVIRMALAANEPGTARLWRNILLALPPERDNAGEIAAEAWPLLLIAGEDGDWRDSRYEAWMTVQADLPPAERASRAAQLLTLAEAAGIHVPPEKWDTLLTAAAGNDRRGSPSVAVWRNLQRANAAKAKAETAALALAMLGGKGGLEIDGQGLASALGALRDQGLTAEAKQIALEAALLRGL
ncbi:hypothetical protein [Ferrovibrio sp.]|uniref:hypothetical protein n=1 Tax=Ferrovibrio sp. TaxID=1917215 RepID=UPI000CA7ABE3|nr:hypothetical protein [Ferrovibrio sp.]PJI38673.1 MAG: hypothetical protein CTR53_15530 [Ferrovibrio sp.]